MTVETFDSEGMFGYKQITTFFEDFSIAEAFGSKAIKDTYNRAFNEWKGNYKYLTELVMVLNWKIWIWCDRNQTMTPHAVEYAHLYEDLWEQADYYACNNLKGDELSYFYATTD